MDERKERVRLLKRKREDLEEEVKLIKEYIEKYREEDKQEKRKRTENDDDSNNDNDRKAKKQKLVSVLQTVPNCTKHFFLSFLNY